MNQQRLKAYLNLIQGLLSCPSGEEWILLRQHEELVNPELIQVMEQVATQLAVEGNLKEAKFLHNLAGQLHHILQKEVHSPSSDEKYQAYLDLIQALLNCPRGSEGEILQANQELIGPGLVKTIQQVARQAKVQGDRETASFLDNLAAQLSRTWLEAHAFKPILKKDKADADLDTQKQKARSDQLQEPPFQPKADITAPSTAEPVSSSSQPDTAINQCIADRLTAIAESLAKLDEILASRFQAREPLWYLNVLERAQASNWILSTDEVEQLIGVKPKCQDGKNSYQRGCWVFVKAGKIGSQTAWRVTKETVNVGSE